MIEHGRCGVFTKYILILSAAARMCCLGAKAQAPAAATKSDSDTSKDASKTELRNNAASLLDDLLGSEKDVSKILIIKHRPARVSRVIEAISKTAGDGQDQLEGLAKEDKTLNLHALQLPPGEVATRDAIRKTKEHELLFSWGAKFDMSLLLSQTDALDYGSHLAKIAAENSASPEQARKFHALDVALSALYQRVVADIRAVPPK
jgi:hypothetical protein